MHNCWNKMRIPHNCITVINETETKKRGGTGAEATLPWQLSTTELHFKSPFTKGGQWSCWPLTCLMKKSLRMLEMMPKLVKRNTQSMIQKELAMHWPFCHKAIITSGVSAVDWWLHSKSTSSSDSLRMSSPVSTTEICLRCYPLFTWLKYVICHLFVFVKVVSTFSPISCFSVCMQVCVCACMCVFACVCDCVHVKHLTKWI